MNKSTGGRFRITTTETEARDMVQKSANISSAVRGLKQRLHRAETTVAITVKASDDALISELLQEIGGHVGRSSGDERTLVISGNSGAAVVAALCALNGAYIATSPPTPQMPPMPGK